MLAADGGTQLLSPAQDSPRDVAAVEETGCASAIGLTYDPAAALDAILDVQSDSGDGADEGQSDAAGGGGGEVEDDTAQTSETPSSASTISTPVADSTESTGSSNGTDVSSHTETMVTTLTAPNGPPASAELLASPLPAPVDPITTAQRDAILNGLQSLITWAGNLNGFGAFANALPLVEQGIGNVLQFGSLLQNSLLPAVQDYFNNAATPTVAGLASALEAIDQTVGAVSGQVVGSDYIFTLDFQDGNSTSRPLSLGPSNDNIDAVVSGSANVDLDVAVDFSFAFGINLPGVDAASADAFFIQVASLTATGSVSASNLNFNLRLGFVDAAVTNGSATLNGSVTVGLTDPNPDGRITQAEFTGTPLATLVSTSLSGSAAVSLPLTVDLPGMGSQTLTLDWADVSQPDAITTNLGSLGDLASLENLTPAVLTGGFSDFAGWADLLNNVFMLGRPLPIIGTQVADTLNIQSYLNTRLITQVGSFNSAQALEAALEAVADLSGVDAQVSNGELTFALDINANLSKTISFELGLDELNLSLNVPSFNLMAALTGRLVFGVELATFTFFVRDDSAEAEFQISASLNVSGFNASGDIGFLTVEATNGMAQVAAALTLDLEDSAGDNKLTADDFALGMGGIASLASIQVGGTASVAVTIGSSFAALPPQTFMANWQDLSTPNVFTSNLDQFTNFNGFQNITPQAFSYGLRQLSDYLIILANDNLTGFNPLKVEIPLLGQSLGDLIDFDTFLDTVLNSFTDIDFTEEGQDIVPFTNSSNLLSLLRAIPGVGASNATSQALPEDLRYTLHMDRSLNRVVPVDLGLDAAGIDLQVTGNITLALALDIDITFGVRKSDGEFFIVESATPQFAATGTVTTNLNGASRLGFINVQLTGGTAALAANLAITLQDPGTDSPATPMLITKTEIGNTVVADLVNLSVTGNASATLPLSASVGTFSQSGNLILSWADITNPAGVNVDASAIQQMFNFNNIKPGDVLEGLLELPGLLADLLDDTAFGKNLPLIGENLEGLINLANRIQGYIDSLAPVGPGGVRTPTFDSAQQLETRLQQILNNAGVPFDVLVSVQPTHVEFLVGFRQNIVNQSLGFAVDHSIGAAGLQAQGNVLVNGSVEASIRFGLNLAMMVPAGQRFFIVPGADSSATLNFRFDGNVNATGSLGLITITANGTARMGSGVNQANPATLSLSLVDPGTTAADNRITLGEIIDSPLGVLGAPTLVGSAVVTLSISSSLVNPQPNPLPGVELTWADLNNPVPAFILTGDFSAYFQAATNFNLNSALAGIQAILGLIDDWVDVPLLDTKIPLIDISLAEVFDFVTAASRFFDALSATNASSAEQFDSFAQSALLSAGFPAGALRELTASTNAALHNPTDLANPRVRYLFHYQETFASAPLSFSPGSDLFSLNLMLNPMVTLDLQLEFGFNKDQGFYIVDRDTASSIINPGIRAANKEVQLALSVPVTDIDVLGTFGPVQIGVKDGMANISFGLNLDLKDPNNTNGIITASEMAGSFSSVVDADVGGNASLDLPLGFFLGNEGPGITAEFRMYWDSSNPGEFHFGSPTGPTDPAAGFSSVKFSLGEWVRRMIGPYVEKINEYNPLPDELIEVLTTRLPVIGDTPLEVLGNVTGADGISLLFEVLNLVNQLNTIINEGIDVDLSSYGLGTAPSNGGQGGAGMGEGSTDGSPTPGQTGFLATLDSFHIELLGGPASQFASNLPGAVIKMLLGQNVDLVAWDPPKVEFKKSYSIKFPIFTIGIPFLAEATVYGEIGGGFSLFADLEIGFNSRGLTYDPDGPGPMGPSFLNGFFIGDNIVDGEDEFETGITAEVFVGVSGSVRILGINAVEIYGKGGVRGTIGLDLADVRYDPTDPTLKVDRIGRSDTPQGDNRVFLDEIVWLAQNYGFACTLSLGGTLEAFLGVGARALCLFGSCVIDVYDEVTFEIARWDIDCETLPEADLAQQQAQALTMFDDSSTEGKRIEIIVERSRTPDRTPQAIKIVKSTATETEFQTWSLTDPGAEHYIGASSGINTLIVEGTDGDDIIRIDPEVTSLPETQHIQFITVNAGAGDDDIDFGNIDPATSNLLGTTINAGDGHDSVIGTFAADTIHGGEGDDTLNGEDGADTIYGGNGNDTLSGGPGNDTLLGEAGVDNIYGQQGVNLIYGGGENDQIFGGDDIDTIYGEDGLDYILGAAGNDTIEGGNSNDTLFGNEDDDTLRGNAGNDEIHGDAGNDTIEGGTGTDTLYGEDGNDNVFGGDQADFIYGGIGNDTLRGENGDDTVHGQNGDDMLYGGNDNDTLRGGNDNDMAWGGLGNDVILGESGIDILRGEDGIDEIRGGSGNDELYGGNQTDMLYGDTGDDYIEGNAGNDIIYGGDNNDRIIGGGTTLNNDLGGADVIDGEAGNDIILGDDGIFGSVILIGGTGPDLINGGSGDDEIHGQGGNDTINGGSGNDLVYGNDGNDTINGDADDDDLHGDAGIDTIHGNDGLDRIWGDAGNDLLYGDAGEDAIRGGADNDTIEGGSEADVIFGDAGTDIISGDAGPDRIRGGDGNDTIYGHNAAGSGDDGAADQLLGDAGTDTLFGQAGDDILDGGADADTLHGGADDDLLIAGTGVGDALNGNAGNDHLVGSDEGFGTDPNFDDATRFGDLLDGGDGDDFIEGLGGADDILGGTGDDIVHAGAGSDRVRAGSGNDFVYAGQGLGDLILGEDGDDELYGSHEGNDQIQGGNGSDLLFGQGGNDQLDGGDGDDFLNGGTGTDTLLGGLGDDELLGGGGVGDTLNGDAGQDLLRGSDDGADILNGGPDNDRILGNGGNDEIHGDAGDDIIDGGAGDDTIEGGAGSDLIVGGANHDLIFGHSLTAVGDDNAVDFLYGDFGTNANEVGSGNDRLFGDGGNDLLFGEGGDDFLDGGSGGSNLLNFGAGEGGVPNDFVTPTPTPAPAVQPGSGIDITSLSLPAGPQTRGRWVEFARSASGDGISSSDSIAIEPAVAVSATGTQYVAWVDGRNGNHEIYIARYTPGGGWEELDGSASGGGISQTLSSSRRPSIALNAAGQPVVSWTEFNGTASDILVAQFDPAANAGQGDWVTMGVSLNPGGISGTGVADHSRIVNTTGGPAVAWLNANGGIANVYIKIFAGGIWSGLGGASSATTDGISNSLSSVRDLVVASNASRVAVAWTQTVGANRQIYLTEYNGSAWSQLSGSASSGGASNTTGASQSPALAYLGNTLFLAWADDTSGFQEIYAVRYDVTSGARTAIGTTAGGVSNTQGQASLPQLASGGGAVHLLWSDDTLQSRTEERVALYARTWSGSAFVEELPGDASGIGVGFTSGNVLSLNLAVDGSGVPYVVYNDQVNGSPQVYLRGNPFDLGGSVYVADGATTVSSILSGNALGAGDVILITGSNPGFTVTSADAGVLILGRPAGQVAAVNVMGADDVILQRLVLSDGLAADGSDRFSLVESIVTNGVVLNGGADAQIQHNTLDGSDGVTLTGGAVNPVIEDNALGVSASGVAFSGTSATGARVRFNAITAGVGVDLAVAADAEIAFNHISAATTGIALQAALTGTIARNDIHDAGVGLAYNAPANVVGNRIFGNTTGVVATLADPAQAFGFVGIGPANEIHDNATGVMLTGRMQNQHIYDNNLGVTGSGVLGPDVLDLANHIEGNTTGVNFTGTIQFNRIYDNQVGIEARNDQIITHNLIYRNIAQGIHVAGRTDARIVSNTIDAPLGDGVRIESASSDVQLLSNILWADTGYAIYVDNNSQTGYFSDYNTLHVTGTGRVAYWTKDFVDILDLQADVARFDLRSVGHTIVDPQGARPQFLNRARADYRVFDILAGQHFTSPSVDAGDPRTDVGVPTYLQNLLLNPGFEDGVNNWVVNFNGGTRSADPEPWAGGSYFFPGVIDDGFAEQTVDLTAYFSAAELDSQDLAAVFGGRVRTFNQLPVDTGEITLVFLDQFGAEIDVPGLGQSRNTIERWELVGARKILPVGTRSVRFEFDTNRESGTTNDSYLDEAFLYVVNDTFLPNQGAHGNTATELAEPTRPRLAMRSPDLYLDWERERPRTILWDSFNNVDEVPVRIDLYQDDPVHGPAFLLTISASTADDGQFIWIPINDGIDFGTYGLRIQVNIVGNTSVIDRSTESFTVPEAGDTYYVDDASNVGDEYTPANVGSNRHTGKLPTAPKPNPVNVLRIYELISGSTMNIDTGLYPMIYTAEMSAITGVGLGNDRGFTMQGPANPALAAELTPAIPGNTAQTLLYLEDADLMQIRYLTLTGGRHALHATGGSTGLTADRLVARDNAQHGILIEGGSNFTLLRDITSHGHPGNFDGVFINGGAGGTIENLVSFNNRNGLFVSASTVNINGAVLFQNRSNGLLQDGSTTGVWDSLVVHGNVTGIDLDGNVDITNSQVFENVGTGIIVGVSARLDLDASQVFSNNEGVQLRNGSITNSRLYNHLGPAVRADYLGVTLAGNVIFSNQYGLLSNTLNSGGIALTNNLFYDHEVASVRITSRTNTGFDLVNNTFYEPVADALYANNTRDIRLRNNIVWVETGYGLRIADDSQTGFASDYNLLRATGTGKVGFWQGDRESLIEWQFATFEDGESFSTDPLFVNALGLDGVLGADILQGLNASFYIGNTLAALSGVPFANRLDRQVAFGPSSGVPVTGLPNDNWAGRWEGYVRIDTAGEHTFVIDSLGPQRLWIDGVLVIDDFEAPSGGEMTHTHTAAGPEWVSVVYEMADNGGNARARLEWITPYTSGGAQLILPGSLSPTLVTADGSDDNFHLQSIHGSFKPGSGYSPDAEQSPAIDRGDPADAFNLEPEENGGFINLGAYGNTAQASLSPAQYILVTNPNGGERLPLGTTYAIRWRSDGFTGDVRLEYSFNGPAGPYTLLADNEANDGNYIWDIAEGDFPVSDQYVIRITSVDTPAVDDTSDSVFSVLPPIANYYVNDAVMDGTEEYTSNPGNDANDGLTPATPKASIRAIIETYDLEFGDVIFVDVGTYNLSANIIIGHDDSGVRIQGPENEGNVALLNRGNVSTGAYGFELNNADAVTLANLSVTGALHGIYLSNGSSLFTLRDAVVFNNADIGLNIQDAGSFGAVVQDNVFYGDVTSDSIDQRIGFFSRGLDPLVERNLAYHINGSDDYGIFLENVGSNAVVRDNMVFNNANAGLTVSASWFEITGNLAWTNGIGFDLNDTTGALEAISHDNTAYGNTTGFEFNGNGTHYRESAFDNTTGFSVPLSEAVLLYELEGWRNTTGIFMQSSTLLDSRFYGNASAGINLDYGNAITVQGNESFDNLIGIYSDTFVGNNLLANNLVYRNSEVGIRLENVQSSSGTMGVANNTVVEQAANAIEVIGNSQNVSIRNNVLWAGGPGHYVLTVGTSAQPGFASDYNLFHFTDGALLGQWQEDFATLTDWRYELGFDTHSISGDPLLVDPDGADDIPGLAEFGGLAYEGWNNATFSGDPVVSGITRFINRGPTSGGLFTGLPSNNQSVRWSGEIYLPVAGDYTFWTISLGAQRLTINGILVVDDFTTPSGTTQSGTYNSVTGDEWVSFTYEMTDVSANAQALVEWATPENDNRRLLRAWEVVETGIAGAGDLRQNLRHDAATPSDGGDDDYHLSSTAGSWHEGTFALDAVDSPGIDAGDLAGEYLLESAPNGGRLNVGAYGNTPEASRSQAVDLQLLTPNGLEKFRVNGGVIIEWRTIGEVPLVDILVSLDNGGSFQPVATGVVNDGNFAWNPATDSNQALVRIVSTLDAAIQDTSDAVFSIGVEGSVYYVNDSVHDGTEEFTSRAGDNTFSGTTPDDPMASLSAVLGSYDLEPGDIIYIDHGTYGLATNVRVTAADAGITILGPSLPGNVALLDRGNTAAGSYALELNNADDVTLDHLSVTGALHGIWIENGSERFTLRDSVIFNNADIGLNIRDAASANAVVQNNLFYGDASSDSVDQRVGFYSLGLDPLVEGNTAFHINGFDDYGIYLENVGTQVVVRDNLFYNNAQAGLTIIASRFEAYDNVARDNNRGFDFTDNTGVLESMTHDNVAYGNTLGFEFNGNGIHFRETAFYNTTGFSVPISEAVLLYELEGWRNTTGIFIQSSTLTDSRFYGNSGTGIELDYGNGITVQGNVIFDNNIGIYSDTFVGNNLVANNLIYRSATAGIRLSGVQSSSGTTRLENNTVLEPDATAVEIIGNSQNVSLRNNILWAGGAGHYVLQVAESAQLGFASNFNLLHFTEGALLGQWQDDFGSLADWRYELGFDQNSLSGDPLFVDADGADDVAGLVEFGGLAYEGWNNSSFTGAPVVTGVTDLINRGPTGGALFTGLPSNNQSVRWTGEMFLPVAGDYTFQVTSLGGQRLIIDGALVVDDVTTPSGTTQAGTYTAAAGGSWVSFVYEVNDVSGNAQALVQWIAPGEADLRYLRAWEVLGGATVQMLRHQADAFNDGTDDDHHLSSTAGSWHGGAFTPDAVNSPGIDSGDLTSVFSGESAPNGGRINLGAYGNTAEASHSTSQYVQLLSFIGGEKVRQGQASLIRWRSAGIGPVDIWFSDDAGATWTLLANDELNDGVFAWNPAAFTLEGRIRISEGGVTDFGAPGAVFDVSADNFTVGVAGTDYYINDALADDPEDEYTFAPGSNFNSGTTPDDPMASLNALLNVYNLNPGDRIFVDSGEYNLPVNVLILAEDSGVEIIGPTGTGHVALLDRNNSASGRYTIQLINAIQVTLRHLAVTGAERGVEAANADGLVLDHMLAFENALYGFHVDAASSQVLVMNSEAWGTTGTGSIDQDTGFYLQGDQMTVRGNVAYKVGAQSGNGIYVDSADLLLLHDNLAYNNVNGITVITNQAEVHHNETRDNDRGLYVDDAAGAVRTAVHDNLSQDNDADGMVFQSNVDAYNNLSILNNGAGIALGNSTSGTVVHHNTVSRNGTGIDADSGTIEFNRVFGNTGAGIFTDWGNLLINANMVFGNAVGIDVRGIFGGQLVTNNIVYDNINQGIQVLAAATIGSNGVRLINNTVHHEAGTGIRLENNGANITVLNNLVVINGGLAIEILGNVTGLHSDYNLLFPARTGANVGQYLNGPILADLTAWQAASGQDAHSVSADPLFIDINGGDNLFGWEQPDPDSDFADFGQDDNFHISGGSPAIDAADGEEGIALDADHLGRVDDLGTLNTGNGVFRFYEIGAYEFRGSSADITAPTVIALTPIGLADGVETNAAIATLIITFSEPLDSVSARSPSLYTLVEAGPSGAFDDGDDILVVVPVISYTPGDTQVRLSFGTQLPDGLYRLTLAGGLDAIVDLSGNRLDGDQNGTEGGDFVRTFRIDRTAPVVQSVTPSGALAVGPSQIQVVFNEAVGMDAVTVTQVLNYVLLFSTDEAFGNADDVDVSVFIVGISYDEPTRTVTLTMALELPAGRYLFVVRSAVADRIGNLLNDGMDHLQPIDVGVPVLDPISDVSTTDGVLVTFTAQATDPDGGNITYSLAPGAPAGAAITPQGVFTWTPSAGQAGATHQITVVATDDNGPALTDSQSFSVEVVFNPPPVLLSIVLNGGEAQRSRVSSLTLRFSEDVSASMEAADLFLFNSTLGTFVDAADLGLAYNSSTHEAVLTFPGLAGQQLAEGNYTLVLLSTAIEDPQGKALGADAMLLFHVLRGDANGDRVTNDLDLFRVWQNLLRPDAERDLNEDLDGDGLVTFSDVNVVRDHYLAELPGSGGGAGAGVEEVAPATTGTSAAPLVVEDVSPQQVGMAAEQGSQAGATTSPSSRGQGEDVGRTLDGWRWVSGTLWDRPATGGWPGHSGRSLMTTGFRMLDWGLSQESRSSSMDVEEY